MESFVYHLAEDIQGEGNLCLSLNILGKQKINMFQEDYNLIGEFTYM